MAVAVAAAAAAMGVEDGRRFILGRVADYPRPRPQAKKNFKIDTPYLNDVIQLSVIVWAILILILVAKFLRNSISFFTD